MTDKRLLANRFSLAEMRRQQFLATVPDHVTIDDVLVPEFWVHVAAKVRPYDEIIVGRDDCTWRLSLVVADVWSGGVKVVELSRVELVGALEKSTEEANGLRVQWRGPNARWSVMDAAGQVLHSGFANKDDALAATINAA
ncbi:hypothetical protein [Methylocystis echinoides]|uniref:Uncharacterized protein n=1 Tax=Methylocystis echinoides TaxID=29468 RepID=A0A9W6LS54_9HYPH|nr:hypothetical protein [Methylocystis echinoides]GLI92994.1 hypothetical protein LMG27198_19860 [Methylocystis echinoides]